MKKVFVHAYCRQNLGDDMFLRTLLRRYPDTQFFANIEPQFRTAFAEEHNLSYTYGKRNKALHKIHIDRVTDQLSHRFFYDYFLRMGGSIFMEPLNWKIRKPFPKWQAKLLNGNKYIVGANFGPCFTPEFLERARSSLRYYGGICFRDQDSYSLFSDMDHVRIAPDVLFGYPWYPQPRKGKGVGISVIAPEGKLMIDGYAPMYYDTLADCCDQFIEEGTSVTLLAFCRAEGDATAFDEILRRVKDPSKIATWIYDGNVEAMLERINDCEYLLASRFHAMVIGFMLQKQVLPIIYSRKQSNVLVDIHFGGETWNLLGGEQPQPGALIAKCRNNPKLHDCETLRIDAQKQFVFLDQLLN